MTDNFEKNPKVSIVVPVYNVENYISKCLDSLLAQTYENIEILLINDGSQDNSRIIIDDYEKKDSRIKVIHKKNEGVSFARNVGMSEATGDYICFVDSDDYVMKDYVKYLLKLIVDEKAEIALTTQMFGNFDLEQTPSPKVQTFTGKEATVKMLLYDIPIGVYSKIFKRDFLEKEGIHFNKELFIGEGFNFNIDAFQRANKVVIGNRRIYFYRRDNEMSATTKFSIKKWQNGLEAIQMIRRNLTINNKEIMKAWNFANWRTYSDVYDIMVLASVQNDYPYFFKRVRKITQFKASIAFLVPTSRKQKLRAFAFMIYPRIIPFIMLLRRKKYNIHISN